MYQQIGSTADRLLLFLEVSESEYAWFLQLIISYCSRHYMCIDKPRHTFTKVTQTSPPLVSPPYENSIAVIEYRRWVQSPQGTLCLPVGISTIYCVMCTIFRHWVSTLLSLPGLWTPEDWIHTLLISVFSAPNMVDSTNIFAFLLFHIPWEGITLGVLNEWHRERALANEMWTNVTLGRGCKGICHSLFLLTCLSLCGRHRHENVLR